MYSTRVAAENHVALEQNGFSICPFTHTLLLIKLQVKSYEWNRFLVIARLGDRMKNLFQSLIMQ
jgi:hypothetical protein